MTRTARIRILLHAAIAVVALGALESAWAQCAFDRSPKAKSVKVSLVRAADECPGNLIPVANTTTSDGIPACTPPPLLSPYDFSDDGKCDLTILHKGAKGEACAPESECSEITFSAKCTGLLSPSAMPIDGESGWRLAVNLRLTPNDRANGDMTVIDLPYEYEFPAASAGKIELKLKASALDLAYLQPPPPNSDPFLESCMSVQLAPQGSLEPYDGFGSYNPQFPSVRILDPAGNAFASFGTTVGADTPGGCGIDPGAAAKGIKGSFVRVTTSCPFGSFPAPNSVTSYTVAACAPPTALAISSLRRFDSRKGGCKISLRQIATPCADMPTETCSPLSVNLRCSGIVTGPVFTPTPLDESGWQLRLIVRATISDATAGDVTVVDFPATIDLAPIAKGKVKLKTVLHELTSTGPPPNVLGLPGCMTLEIVEAALHDNVGNKFARLGTAVFPKD